MRRATLIAIGVLLLPPLPAGGAGGASDARHGGAGPPHLVSAPAQERPGDPVTEGQAADRRSAPTAIIPFGPYRSVQVNVDAAGGNVAGDAANEPSLAVDRRRPARLAIGWRQFDTVASRFRQAGFAFSRDQGRRWSGLGHLDPGERGSDPVLESDADGNIFYQSLRFGSPPERRFTSLVSRSTDGGRTWRPSVYAYGGDKPWMAIDRTGGPGRGHVYLAWSPAHSDPAYHFFTRSTDGGASFEAPITMDAYPMLLTTAVGPDGTLYVAGVDYAVGDRVFVCRSTDAQNAFVTPTFDTTSVYIGGRFVFGDSSYTHPNLTDLNGQFWIDVDHSSGPTAGNVYILAAVDPPGPDPLDVFLVRSTDGGDTWSAPIRINDDSPGPGGYQWFGTLAVAPDGRVDAVWSDTRNLGVVYMSALYHAHSTDGGLTWSPNEQLSPLWSSYIGFPHEGKIGDYYDMVSDRLGAHIAWAATFNNEQDVYYTRVGPYDCNGNGVDDSLDVALGTSADLDRSGIPDECEFPDRIQARVEITGTEDIILPGGPPVSGHVQEFRVGGALAMTQILVEEGDYIRWHAEKPAGESDFVPFPPGSYLVKTRSVSVGDTWTSFFNEPALARVVRQEAVALPGGSLACFVVEYEAVADGDLQATMWFADGFGPVRYVNHGEGLIADFGSRHLAGGSGLYPMAIGNWWSSEDPATAVGPAAAAPFSLRAHPNPLAGETRVSFTLPEAAHATLAAFDVRGARVRTLHEGALAPGRHEFSWRGADGDGAPVAAGIYFVRLRTGDRVATRKLVVLR